MKTELYHCVYMYVYGGFCKSGHNFYGLIQYHSIIMSLLHMCPRSTMRNLQCIPDARLCGPCFLMAWNIHVSCNSLRAMCGIVRHEVAMQVTTTHETILLLASTNKHGITLIFYYSKNVKSFFPFPIVQCFNEASQC